MTDSLAALGLLALITSGELNHWFAVAVLVGLALAVVIPENFQDRPWMHRIGVVLPLTLLGAQAVRLFTGASLLETAVEFAAGLQVIRLATRRGAAHDQQVIVLALLHLIAATVLGSGLAYGLCFLGFLVIAAFFLNQLSQFALSVGVPYSAQTIIQALALGFGIGVYSLRWRGNVRKTT